MDRRARHVTSVVMLQVPGDGVRAGSSPLPDSVLAQFDDQVDRGLRQAGGAGVRPT